MAAAGVALVTVHQDRIGRAIAHLAGGSVPVRIGLAYPLARRFRTAMTVGMFCIIILTLVYISVMSYMFRTQADVIAANKRGSWPLRLSPGERDEARAALAMVGGESLLDSALAGLSGGELQRAYLARALITDPELLLLDEPTAGLVLDWQERLTEAVAELHGAGGVTIVMVTHEVDRLPPSCTGVVLLRAGRAVACGSPEEVLTGDRLSALYGCVMEVIRSGGRTWARSVGTGSGGTAAP